MPTGVYPRTEKHSFNKGRRHENRKKPVTIVTLIYKVCLTCSKTFITDYRMPKKKFCSRSCVPLSKHFTTKGMVGSDKQRKFVQSIRGEKHPNWKGGVSRSYKTGYYSVEYKNWRSSVFKRDNYMCKGCGVTNTFITAHHIKSFAHYPLLRFDLSNGITLCEECHKKTDNYKGRNKCKSTKL